MRELSRLLVNLLLGDQRSARDSADIISRENLWYQAIALSAAWRVIPQVRKRIVTLSISPGPPAEQRLHIRSAEAAAQSMVILHRCSMIFKRLNSLNLSVVAFKGIGLIANLYDNPADRMINDIDLLISSNDFERVNKILKDMGFSPETDRLENETDFLENRCLCLTDGDGIQIDLHWTIGPIPRAGMLANDILKRAEIIKIYGTPIRVASPIDSMMLTIHHALQNNLAPFAAVKDLCDLDMWWSVQPQRWKVEEAIKHAQLCGLFEPCLALWKILTHSNSESPASEGAKELSLLGSTQENNDADRLEDIFWLQLRERMIGRYLLRVLADFSSINQFIVSRLRGGADNIFLKHYKSRQGLARFYLTQALEFIREVVRLTPYRLTLYLALRRAHNRYSSLSHHQETTQ